MYADLSERNRILRSRSGFSHRLFYSDRLNLLITIILFLSLVIVTKISLIHIIPENNVTFLVRLRPRPKFQ